METTSRAASNSCRVGPAKEAPVTGWSAAAAAATSTAASGDAVSGAVSVIGGYDILESGFGIRPPSPLGDVADHDVGRRDGRDGEERARDAGQDRASSDAEHDSQRVHLDRGAHDERLEHVTLDLL